MTSTFGNVHTGEDICRAVENAACCSYEGLVSFKDGRPPIQGAIWVNDSYHPDKDFGVMVVEDHLTSKVVGVDYDEVASIALGGPFGPPPEPQFSADGKPFHNGYCWQESGDICQELGYCTNPDCVDPTADQEARKKHNLPSGYYCGARIKTMTCPGCGHTANLT